MSRPVAWNSWTVVPKPNPSAKLRLFCFPYAGGGASIFYGWPQGLPSEVEVCGVQLPGREGRLNEKPFSDLHALADTAAIALEPYFEKPFAFFGHSNGGLIAFELTRRLRREGKSMPLQLFPSGLSAPQVKSNQSPIHTLPESEFIQELRRFRGTSEEILQNAELMQLILPLLRADFTLSETYVYTPEPPFSDIPITALGGAQDTEVHPEVLSAWREQTSDTFRQSMFPGDHFFVNSHRSMVLEALTRELRMLLTAMKHPRSACAG